MDAFDQWMRELQIEWRKSNRHLWNMDSGDPGSSPIFCRKTCGKKASGLA